MIQKTCKCGERWMHVYLSDIYSKEDDKLVENLIRFVDSCDCMKNEKELLNENLQDR
jgi:hypothetical protein